MPKEKLDCYRMLINAVDPEECRIALIKGNLLEDFGIETTSGEFVRGNIYKGIVTRVEPSLQAAFVDYGAEKNGFLQRHEIHSDYYAEDVGAKAKGLPSIQHLIKSKQELLVQVTKEPSPHKGAMLSTYISLPGRYCVLMPGGKTSGMSRRIEDDTERKRLKEIVDALDIPEGFATIIRTAGKDQKKRDIEKDVRYLLRLWKTINKQGVSTAAPCLLYKERHLAIRVVRDRLTPEVDEILVDSKEVYRDLKDFVTVISPRQARIVKLYKDPEPIFTKYEIESQIDSIFANRVDLESGGHIVISSTEALVAIDVNSGRSTREASVEKTAFTTNMEAASEISRQLRMRDLGGLVVIDFIDMRDRNHKQQVVKAMKEHTKLDKARISLGTISRFGLMELIRQRIAAPVEYGTFVPCPHCGGKGSVPGAEKLALEFLRKVRSEILKDSIAQINGAVPTNVADYLLNRKRRELLDVEDRHNVKVIIEADSSLQPGQSRIASKRAQPQNNT